MRFTALTRAEFMDRRPRVKATSVPTGCAPRSHTALNVSLLTVTFF